MFEILEKYDAMTSRQNTKLDTPLHIAAFFNNTDFITKYLTLENEGKIKSSTPSIQILNKSDLTPLLVTLVSNNEKCFELLVNDKNAKLNVKSPSGNSAYHVCAEYANINGLKYLLKNFYSKNAGLLTTKNRKENTVLHLAAQKGSLDIVFQIYETIKNSSTLEPFLFSKVN